MTLALARAATGGPSAHRLRRLFGPRLMDAFPLIAPVHALVFTLLVIPGLYVLWLSLHASTFGMAPSYVGWSNYSHVLADAYFWRALLNTVKQAGYRQTTDDPVAPGNHTALLTVQSGRIQDLATLQDGQTVVTLSGRP